MVVFLGGAEGQDRTPEGRKKKKLADEQLPDLPELIHEIKIK